MNSDKKGPDGHASAAEAALGGIFFGFQIGGFGFLAPANLYCEIIEQVQVNPLPSTQAWFSGLVNLRGNLVPVFDLHRLFGEEVADPKKRRLFTIDKGEKAVALWIDGLPAVHDAFHKPLEQLPALPAELENHVLAGYAYQDRIWLNVRFDQFFRALGRHVALE